MTGYSEFDFKHALHAYGVIEGIRTEQYSNVIAKEYIISNDTGEFDENAEVNYTVSLGQFTIDGHEWEDKPYSELEAMIESANRLGAYVTLSPSYIDTGDESKDNLIVSLEGPMDDGTIHVRVMHYLENSDEDPADEEIDPPAPSEDEEVVPSEETDPEPADEPADEPEDSKADEEASILRVLSRILFFCSRYNRG